MRRPLGGWLTAASFPGPSCRRRSFRGSSTVPHSADWIDGVKKSDRNLIDDERTIDVSELFFSETDLRGHIRFGNRVFERVSGYQLDDMIGRPHNIVRHPHMPRAVFRVLWDHLERSETVVAYVKNLASDGRHYWVLAAVMPTGDGYVSIRLKPSSPMFDTVTRIYNRTRALEEAALHDGVSPPEAIRRGVEHLLAEIEGLGFDGYAQFMRAALIKELGARELVMPSRDRSVVPQSTRTAVFLEPAVSTDPGSVGLTNLANVHRTCADLTAQLSELVADGGSLSGLRSAILPKAHAILELGETVRLLALNAEIESNRLGEVAATLRAIAEQLGDEANGGKLIVDELAHRLRALLEPIEELLYDLVLAALKIEMVGIFVGEILTHPSEDAEKRQRSVSVLVGTFVDSAQHIVPALQAMDDRLLGVDEQMRLLRLFLRTLGYIQIAGRIESSRDDRVAVFRGIFEAAQEHTNGSHLMLEQLHDEIGSAQQQIEYFAQLVGEALERLQGLIAGVGLGGSVAA